MSMSCSSYTSRVLPDEVHMPRGMQSKGVPAVATWNSKGGGGGGGNLPQLGAEQY